MVSSRNRSEPFAHCIIRASQTVANEVGVTMGGFADPLRSTPRRQAGAGACSEESSGVMTVATDDAFLTCVLESDKLVLVDFWAEWCPPCHALAPVLDEIAKEYSHVISVVKIDVDENREIALDFDVTCLPTITVFRGGDVVARLIGSRGKNALLGDLAAYLMPR